MPEESPHDIVEFMQQILSELQSEYKRIRERTLEDPGTAGDEGEENWAELFRDWLPATYHVVTKGRILTSLGEASPQVDVLILHPDYPKKLRNKKHYLSSGVLAAFECKNTLRRDGIRQAIENARHLSEILERERNTKGYWKHRQLRDLAYEELHKPITYGLLAHSHDWASESSRETVDRAINDIDLRTSTHPREMIDIICVADVAVWSTDRCPNTIQIKGLSYTVLEACSTTISCLHADRWRTDSVYHKSYTTIGALISRLYQKLSRSNDQTTPFANYFRLATKDGVSGGGQLRVWGDVLSVEARKAVRPGDLQWYF
jgi:hypothetical protein